MGTKCPECHSENPDTSTFCADCGTNLSSPRDISVTKTIETPVEEFSRGTLFADRYEIIENLGKGGIGDVYRVSDTKIREEVALKLLKPGISSDKKKIERFRNELKLARKIRHKNVCQMFDLGETAGTHFITMEYVPGEDLKSFIHRSGRIDIPKAVSIAKQVCEGLSAAHGLGVVHRDLKPSNLMIDKEGNSRIMDFGIALSQEVRGLTDEGIAIGTPEYMSPEQVEAKKIDHRSDIYSLGVILYEMVTGQLPFEGETPLSIAVQHKSEIPKIPTELNPQIPEVLSQLILKCMAKAKEDRFQSADQILQTLTNLEKEIPATQKKVKKKRTITSKEITVTLSTKKIFIPALVIIFLVIAGLFLWRPWSEKGGIPKVSDKPSLAVFYFENNSGNDDLDHWREGMSTSLTTDLSQSKYLHVISTDEVFNVLRNQNLDEAEKYSSEDLVKLAAQAEVNHMVTGDYITAGNKFICNVTLHKLGKKKEIISFREECDGQENIMDLVDSVTKRLKTELDLSSSQITSDPDKEAGDIITRSPEALKFYLEGRKFHSMLDYPKAIEMLENAIALDKDFAMAYWALAAAYGNIGNISRSDELLQKAIEMGDRITDRLRLRIQANQYWNKRQIDKVKETAQELVSLYPDDYRGYSHLGNAHFNLYEFDKAVRANEIPIQKKVDYAQLYFNQALFYSCLGKYSEGENVLNLYLDNFSDNLGVYRTLFNICILQKKYDLALETAERFFVFDPTSGEDSYYKGKIYLFMGDLKKTEEEFENLLEHKDEQNHFRGYIQLSNLYIHRGQFRKAIDVIKKRIDLSIALEEKGHETSSRSRLISILLKSGDAYNALLEHEKAYTPGRAMPIKGMIYVELDRLKDAQKAAEGYQASLKSWQTEHSMRWYYYLMGKIEASASNFSNAIDLFNDAIALLPFENVSKDNNHAEFMNSLASAYFQSKQYSLAQEKYETITSLTLSRLGHGDIYAKAFYMLGKIYEQQGIKTKAIENYEKFLDLWKDADPGIEEVEDAKKRLAGLKSQI